MMPAPMPPVRAEDRLDVGAVDVRLVPRECAEPVTSVPPDGLDTAPDGAPVVGAGAAVGTAG